MINKSRATQDPPDIIQLWCPNIFEFKGGIQAFSGFLLNALSEQNEKIDCFLLHDANVPQTPIINVKFFLYGKYSGWIRKFLFSLSILWRTFWFR
ncbi:MAG: hypothetical protein KDD53_01745, partial [Bdellovibrionales bacterium]|nr:hypothetical protein [Bdellovibrionales bacterium]